MQTPKLETISINIILKTKIKMSKTNTTKTQMTITKVIGVDLIKGQVPKMENPPPPPVTKK